MPIRIRHRLKAVAEGEADAPAIWLQRFKQGFTLDDHALSLCAEGVVVYARSTQTDFQIAGEVASGDGPVFGAAFIVFDPAFDLAGFSIDDTRIICNHRSSSVCARATQANSEQTQRKQCACTQ